MLKTEIGPLENDKEWLVVTDAELLDEIGRRFRVCSQSFVDLANVIGVAVRRGLDVSIAIDNPLLLDVLRKIESNQIVPELAEKYLHSKSWIFHRLKNLPTDDQKMIVETGSVSVVVRRDDEFDVRKIQVSELTERQCRLVFAPGRIRTETEMIAILEDADRSQKDPFDDATVNVKIVADIDMTKAQRKRFNELKDKAGSMTEFVKRLLMRKLEQ